MPLFAILLSFTEKQRCSKQYKGKQKILKLKNSGFLLFLRNIRFIIVKLIIRKTQRGNSDEFYILMKGKYGEECADYFAKELSFDKDLENFKNSDFYLLNVEDIDEVANGYFSDLSKIEDVKAEVALFWLNKINSKHINLR
ncbi:hypothetical protein EZS27_011093 [termite gut metagenome]|uniref:Uncharacterized protein n=1 Tax=termite gut metagenome TaxID=433724 RepID=A0A5J4S4L1_9ZZZZ